MSRKLACIPICKKVRTQNFRHVTDFLRPPHKYSFGEMDEIGLIAPEPPGFSSRMVLNRSQWNLDHMENVYFFLKRLSFCT